MNIKQKIGPLNFAIRGLINQVNIHDEWNEELFVEIILDSADYIRPYITGDDEITVPRIVIALSQQLVCYAESCHILPHIMHQAASLHLATEVASWLNRTENTIDETLKNMSKETIYDILDKYERHLEPDGSLNFTFWQEK